jgi:CBS domain containing-hemolysin-like protein
MSFDYLLVFTSLLLSAFFSGMELAYLASNRLKIEVQIKQNTFQGKILSVFLFCHSLWTWFVLD